MKQIINNDVDETSLVGVFCFKFEIFIFITIIINDMKEINAQWADGCIEAIFTQENT